MNTMNTPEYPNIWVFMGIHYKNLGIHYDEYVFEYPCITLCLAPLVQAITFVCTLILMIYVIFIDNNGEG